MKSVDKIYDVFEIAKIILLHHCSKRSLKRINGTKGDGPGYLNCHKKHAVLDTPYCTSHQYIHMKVSLNPSYTESLKECGLFTTEIDEIGI